MAKKLWGGRFKKEPDPLVEDFGRSISYDSKLAKYDILGSFSHVGILYKAGFLSKNEYKSLHRGLFGIEKDLTMGKLAIDLAEEDIHTFIQNELQKRVGNVALKLHTARSRNDQVVFATKCYCKCTLLAIEDGILDLMQALVSLVRRNKDLIIPGFTHLQHAQPVYVSAYVFAYYDMLMRDQQRLAYIGKNMIISLGAGALAGTPIDAARYNVTVDAYLKGLGLKGALNIYPTRNSLDTVSDRDFVIEIISALSILAMHLSRLSEDLILWSTKEFDFVELDDAYCTGSSLMPQKKNPDVLELTRGYAGRLYGNLVSVLTMMKGLPLTYNRDMQLDKEPLFNSFEIVSMELKVLAGLVKTLKFNRDKIAKHLEDESLYATDIVYYLVGKKIPFKEAHTIVGRLVQYSLDKAIFVKDMSEEKLKEFSNVFVKKEVVKLFDPIVSVQSKKSVRKRQ